MFKKYLIPALALFGLFHAIRIIFISNGTPPVQQAIIEPPKAPYESFIAGAGIIETSTEDIAVSPEVSGVIGEVLVVQGQEVTKDAPLFRLREGSLTGLLLQREASLVLAEEKLKRLQEFPRPEEIPAAQAKVTEAQALVSDADTQLALVKKVADQRAISADEVSKKRFAADAARARFAAAQADFALLTSGTWSRDLDVAKADVMTARSQRDATLHDISLLTVKAPVAGTILRITARPGEFIQAGASSSNTPIVMGATTNLHVRVDIDENDTWRLKEGSQATAFIRGNNDISIPLTFVRVDPYVIPKRSLTGESTERVDTRVLQVLYSFKKQDRSVYVGQLVDVFIDARS